MHNRLMTTYLPLTSLSSRITVYCSGSFPLVKPTKRRRKSTRKVEDVPVGFFGALSVRGQDISLMIDEGPTFYVIDTNSIVHVGRSPSEAFKDVFPEQMNIEIPNDPFGISDPLLREITKTESIECYHPAIPIEAIEHVVNAVLEMKDADHRFELTMKWADIIRSYRSECLTCWKEFFDRSSEEIAGPVVEEKMKEKVEISDEDGTSSNKSIDLAQPVITKNEEVSSGGSKKINSGVSSILTNGDIFNSSSSLAASTHATAKSNGESSLVQISAMEALESDTVGPSLMHSGADNIRRESVDVTLKFSKVENLEVDENFFPLSKESTITNISQRHPLMLCANFSYEVGGNVLRCQFRPHSLVTKNESWMLELMVVEQQRILLFRYDSVGGKKWHSVLVFECNSGMASIRDARYSPCGMCIIVLHTDHTVRVVKVQRDGDDAIRVDAKLLLEKQFLEQIVRDEVNPPDGSVRRRDPIGIESLLVFDCRIGDDVPRPCVVFCTYGQSTLFLVLSRDYTYVEQSRVVHVAPDSKMGKTSDPILSVSLLLHAPETVVCTFSRSVVLWNYVTDERTHFKLPSTAFTCIGGICIPLQEKKGSVVRTEKSRFFLLLIEADEKHHLKSSLLCVNPRKGTTERVFEFDTAESEHGTLRAMDENADFFIYSHASGVIRFVKWHKNVVSATILELSGENWSATCFHPHATISAFVSETGNVALYRLAIATP